MSSIRGRLTALVAAVAIPATAALAYLSFQYADTEMRLIEARRFDNVNNLSFLLDGEVKAIEAGLKVMAKSNSIMQQNFEEFRSLADRGLSNVVRAIAVIDNTGQQIFSTAISVGNLPVSQNFDAFKSVFEGKTVVTSVIRGTVAGRPIIAVVVPVFGNGAVVAALSAVVYPEEWLSLFDEAGVNPKWASAVVDRNGMFVLRNLDRGAFIGEPAKPELREAAAGPHDVGTFTNVTIEGVATGNSYRRSPITGWTSVVSVPKDTLLASFHSAALQVGLLTLFLLGLGGLLTALAAQKLAGNVRALEQAAIDVMEGRRPREFPIYVDEFKSVLAVYQKAAELTLARQRQHEQIEVLMHEMAHRSKNLIAVVQSLASISSKSSTTLDEFRVAFLGRLRGLAASQDFLFQTPQGGRLCDLISAQLAPFASDRNLKVDSLCTAVLIQRETVENLGLAFYELATNSSKYGALSTPFGLVEIGCALESKEGIEQLRISWQETGGPTVVAPVRKGFGSFVIKDMLQRALNAEVELDYDPQGLKWAARIRDKFFSIQKRPEEESGKSPAKSEL